MPDSPGWPAERFMRVIGLSRVVTAIADALLCFALRMVAIHRG